jgi:hypothetical protein
MRLMVVHHGIGAALIHGIGIRLAAVPMRHQAAIWTRRGVQAAGGRGGAVVVVSSWA